jgi:hypothetical protein
MSLCLMKICQCGVSMGDVMFCWYASSNPLGMCLLITYVHV